MILKRASDNHAVHRVAIAILHYLRDHPSAKDSARGIAKWWVGEEHEVVEKALALLVQDGVMAKQRHVYQFAPNRRSQNAIAEAEKTLRRLQRKR